MALLREVAVKELYNLFVRPKDPLSFNAVRISLASPEKIREDLLTMGRRVEITSLIETILFHPGFPVDIRHNAKIFREKLAVWASRRVKHQGVEHAD